MARHGGGRPTVESARSISVGDFVSLGIFGERGASFRVPMTWTRDTWNGPVRMAEAEFLVSVAEGEAQIVVKGVTLHQHWTGGEVTVAAGQVIDLTTRPVHFGGRRWYFVCPRTGNLALRLHLPLGASGFASRRAYRLGYAVQRETLHDKALRRARKARAKIGGSVNLTLPLPGKPKWMRWRTFLRLRGGADRALGTLNEHSAIFLRRLMHKTGSRSDRVTGAFELNALC